jgi:hypothetical protein
MHRAVRMLLRVLMLLVPANGGRALLESVLSSGFDSLLNQVLITDRRSIPEQPR